MELKRLIGSLLASKVEFGGMVINDDWGDPEVKMLVETVGIKATYLTRPRDPGNSAASGWNRGLDAAFKVFQHRATHYLIIDDDAVLESDSLELMLEALRRTGARSAFPSALDEGGQFYSTSMLIEHHWQSLQLLCRTREDVVSRFGDALPAAWLFQGLCHLMDREVVASGIRFDEDFWMCGEDLDFGARVAQDWGSVYVPRAFARHLCGAPLNPASALNSNYLKRLSYLQNATFMGYWRPYGKKLRGRYFDFLRGKGLWPICRTTFKDFGFNRYTIYDLFWIIFYGMVRGDASNRPSGRALRHRRRNYLVSKV
jgi:GT2 family glycosyltransferase